MSLHSIAGILDSPEVLLGELIRFNTTNPPGDEAECIEYLYGILNEAGIEAEMYGKSPNRQNLVARLKGEGTSSPLLMYGHADVVTTENQVWKNPPFEGVVKDGCIWGRGALDMKGAVTMMVTALLRAKINNIKLPGDVILCILSDEEDGGTYGAKYMVEEHPKLFEGVRYAIGEIGGFTMYINNKKFYPIMTAEKQRCCLKATIKGPGGHGSMPTRGGAMAKLAAILETLDKRKLPVHVTPPVRQMIETLASHMSFPASAILRQLLNPSMTDSILKVLGKGGHFFDPILHNTVNATIVRGGNKINVIPCEITLEFDGRILPGYKVEDILGEIKDTLGSEVEIEVTAYDKGPSGMDMGLFDTLSQILKEGDVDGIPVPFVVSGVTDARFFSQLGIQTYGFTPMILPKDMDFAKLLHGADERIPIEALRFGTDAINKLLSRF